MYAYTMDQNKEFSLETSRQMVLKLRNKMNEYETMTRQLSEDPQLTTFLETSYKLPSAADVYVPSVSYYPSLYSISYFVLYDDSVLPGFRPYSQTTCLCLLETDTSCRTLMGMERERFSG